MTGFNEDQMHRPLFEEPTAALERPSQWSEPLGFMVGGMANQKYQQLGQQYFNAAHYLVESIKHQDVADSEVANPILYLYRHSIELFLKAVMLDAAKTHSLDSLAEEYRAFIKEEFDADCPEWIITRMKELGGIDPNSTAFRYNMTYDKSAKADIPVDGEFHVNLHHFQSAMTALNVALVGTIAMVACGEGKSAQ
ncbi:hypothetical protein ACRDNQ_17130 [Palleronia sp. KMU-117]|uniref:hypothetical protein n=1 Tax=Palleronia sp. KMU-117 TaxID=3434108 RepID=UPI003D73E534